MRRTYSRLMMAAFCGMLTTGFAGLTGCEEDGPFERAGREADEATEEVGEAVEEVGEELEDAGDR